MLTTTTMAAQDGAAMSWTVWSPSTRQAHFLRAMPASFALRLALPTFLSSS